MKVGIMQPYFFPYLGHFQLIQAVDEWIVFDTPQYIRHGWVNRNRILKPDGNDWQYVLVPLKKHHRDTTIKDVEINNAEDWRSRILGQLTHYKTKGRYFADTMDVVRQAIKTETDSLVTLNISTLKTVCDYLGLKFNYKVYSQMGLNHPVPNDAGEWALRISEAIGAKTYINPLGGQEIFDAQKYSDAGIELLFLQTNLASYGQRNNGFVPGLSIIDLMMFNPAQTVKDMLLDYKLVEK